MSERKHTWSPEGKHDSVPRSARARKGAGTVQEHLVLRMWFCVRCDALLESAQPQGLESRRHSLRMDLRSAAHWQRSPRLMAGI